MKIIVTGATGYVGAGVTSIGSSADVYDRISYDIPVHFADIMPDKSKMTFSVRICRHNRFSYIPLRSSYRMLASKRREQYFCGEITNKSQKS